jgi:hypothetical protein
METPLSPLDFARRARRARRLYGEREAVIDGDRRYCAPPSSPTPRKSGLILRRLDLMKALKHLKFVA